MRSIKIGGIKREEDVTDIIHNYTKETICCCGHVKRMTDEGLPNTKTNLVNTKRMKGRAP
jgi:hypothetical protein